MPGVPKKGRNLDTDNHSQKKENMKRQREKAFKWLCIQANECQGISANTRS